MIRPRLVTSGAEAAIDRAADWAVRSIDGSLGTDERLDLDSWLAEPKNSDAYVRVGNVLSIFDDLDGIDMAELDALRREARDYSSRRKWIRWAGAATIAASIAGVTSFMVIEGSPVKSGPAVHQIAAAEIGTIPAIKAPADAGSYATAIGEQRTLILADGSRVTMNTGTQITIDFRADRRLIRLVRGQALFNVAHNPRRPFSVTAGGRVVTALGTIFEVQVGRGQLRVTLVRGRVVIDPPAPSATAAVTSPPEAPAILTPGQQFTVTLRSNPAVRFVDANRELLWRQQLVEFKDAPLAQAVAELNRYSTKPITVSDREVATMRISGVYKTGDPSAFATSVAAMLPVAARETDRGEIELYHAENAAR